MGNGNSSLSETNTLFPLPELKSHGYLNGEINNGTELHLSIFELIPLPLWETIFKTIKASEDQNHLKFFPIFRLTCKTFRYIISKYWRQKIPFDCLKSYVERCCKIKFFPQSIYITPPFLVKTKRFKSLQLIPYLKELKIDRDLKISNYELKFLPSTLERLDLEHGTEFNIEGLKTLPSSIRFLNLHKCLRISKRDLLELPLHTQLLYSFKSKESNLLVEFIYSGDLEAVKTLIRKGFNVNQATLDTGTTPLYVCSQLGHLGILRELIHNGVNINQSSTDTGTNALFIASQKGNLEIVKELIKNGANVNQPRFRDGAYCLYIAVQQGHIPTIRELIKSGANVNCGLTSTKTTPLYYASFKGDLSILKELITNGANVNLPSSSNGSPPLFIAAQKGNLEIVKELINNGANVNQGRLLDSTPPIFMASYYGYIAIVKELIKNGANINQGNNFSPLFGASQHGQLETVKLLLQHFADPNATCELKHAMFTTKRKDPIEKDLKYFFTPIYIAWWNDREDIISILKPISDIQLNIELATKNNHFNALKFFEFLLEKKR